MTDQIDLSWAVQRAIYEVVAPAIAPAQLVDCLPAVENLPDLVAYFGDDPVQEIGGKGSRLERHDPTIHVLATGSSRKRMRDLQEMIRAALHDQEIECDGAALSKPQLQTSNGQQIEASTYLGTQTFSLFAQPAD